MQQFTLITGASSGIGMEMAKILAAKGHNLIITARSHDKLNQLKTQLEKAHHVSVIVLPADLSNPANAELLYQEVVSKGLHVSMLVNNAGFGLYGNFNDTALQKELEMINLNIASLVVLTKLFLQEMRKRGQGRIQNIASLLSYLPFPYYAVYSATKAFVLAFTETVAAEQEDTGVVITSVCPGPVDTNFTTSEMLNTNAYKTNKPANAVKVAEAAVAHLLQGKGNKVIGFNNWFISNLPRITPDTVMIKIKKKLASQTR